MCAIRHDREQIIPGCPAVVVLVAVAPLSSGTGRWAEVLNTLLVLLQGPLRRILRLDANELYVKYAIAGMENLVLAGRFALQLPERQPGLKRRAPCRTPDF